MSYVQTRRWWSCCSEIIISLLSVSVRMETYPNFQAVVKYKAKQIFSKLSRHALAAWFFYLILKPECTRITGSSIYNWACFNWRLTFLCTQQLLKMSMMNSLFLNTLEKQLKKMRRSRQLSFAMSAVLCSCWTYVVHYE